jgi:hypothetical protein
MVMRGAAESDHVPSRYHGAPEMAPWHGMILIFANGLEIGLGVLRSAFPL